MPKEKKEYVIDVDVIIDKLNNGNPKVPASRKTLADAIGKTPQLFSDWKNKKTPKLVELLMELKQISGLNIDEFIIEKK